MMKEAGFTLMEVLVALVLLTLFTIVTYRALDAVLTTQRQATARMERLNELAVAFSLMNSDLANSTVPANPQDPAISGLLTLMEEDGAKQFNFVRLLPADAEQGLKRVGYRCKGDSLSRLIWVDENNLADPPREFTLLSSLQDCTFKFLNAAGQWQTTWQPHPGNLFPRAIELNIIDADSTPFRRVMAVQ
jgi:general secretion pathway protein J